MSSAIAPLESAGPALPAAMKIGELARLSGQAPSRIRFYEASGLVRGVERQHNGYRQYGPEALWTLEIIACAQQAGFTLDEIRQLLPAGQEAGQHDQLLASLQRKVDEIEALRLRLAENQAQLRQVIEAVRSQPPGQACADRAQWVLQRIRQRSGTP